MIDQKAYSIFDEKLNEILQLVEVDKAAMDKEALLFLLNSKEGRWFLMRLLDRTDVFSNTFRCDAAAAAYCEGRRSVGIDVMTDITSMGVEGLKLKQMAELEYAQLIQDAYEMRKKLIEQHESENN